MTAENVKTIVLPELVELYQKPFGVDSQERALKAYIESLQDVPKIALEKGWSDVKRDHTSQTRPTIGVILEACRKYYKSSQNEEHPPSQRECFNTAQGQYALQQGHGKNFYATCYQRKEVIDMFETKKVIERNERVIKADRKHEDWRIRERAEKTRRETAKTEKALSEKYLNQREGVA